MKHLKGNQFHNSQICPSKLLFTFSEEKKTTGKSEIQVEGTIANCLSLAYVVSRLS